MAEQPGRRTLMAEGCTGSMGMGTRKDRFGSNRQDPEDVIRESPSPATSQLRSTRLALSHRRGVRSRASVSDPMTVDAYGLDTFVFSGGKLSSRSIDRKAQPYGTSPHYSIS